MYLFMTKTIKITLYLLLSFYSTTQILYANQINYQILKNDPYSLNTNNLLIGYDGILGKSELDPSHISFGMSFPIAIIAQYDVSSRISLLSSFKTDIQGCCDRDSIANENELDAYQQIEAGVDLIFYDRQYYVSKKLRLSSNVTKEQNDYRYIENTTINVPKIKQRKTSAIRLGYYDLKVPVKYTEELLKINAIDIQHLLMMLLSIFMLLDIMWDSVWI